MMLLLTWRLKSSALGTDWSAVFEMDISRWIPMFQDIGVSCLLSTLEVDGLLVSELLSVHNLFIQSSIKKSTF